MRELVRALFMNSISPRPSQRYAPAARGRHTRLGWWKWSRRRLPGLLLGFLLPLLGMARAQAGAPTEYQVKAAYLYNFTRYVEWPDSAFAAPESPFVVGVVGHDPFGPTLDKILDGRTMNGRPFLVKRFKHADDVQPCQLLFVGEYETDKLPRILSHLGNAGTLTVGESYGFLQHGGAINFLIEDNHVRFEINLNAADRCGLKISSKLLALARNVIPRHS
jgi:hypothetical protein